MRIITYNVNGIRSAFKKGFLDWLKTEPADVICLQEVKAMKEDLDCDAVEALGYHTYWFSAQKKGYSGVAVFTKIRPTHVVYGDGREQSDFEGRVIRLDFDKLTLINAYFPSGTTGEIRQAYKYVWLDEFFELIADLRKTRDKLIICGDYNIAHKAIDIHNPVSNKKTSGFLPEERAWMDKFLEAGFTDTFRHINKDPHHYSWWSQRANSRANNKGWRIDYITLSAPLHDTIKHAEILPDIAHSDHCPVRVELQLL